MNKKTPEFCNRLYMLNVFLDTETTGLDPMRHRVIEIAFKVVESHEVIVSYEAIIEQPAEVLVSADPQSMKVHGISVEEILY